MWIGDLLTDAKRTGYNREFEKKPRTEHFGRLLSTAFIPEWTKGETNKTFI